MVDCEVTALTTTTLLGVTVQVNGFHLEDGQRYGTVVICRHRRPIGAISVADVRVEPVFVAALSAGRLSKLALRTPAHGCRCWDGSRLGLRTNLAVRPLPP